MDFQIGDVVNRTFGAISRNFVTFFLLAMLLVGVPALVVMPFQSAFLAGDIGGFIIWLLVVFISVAVAYVLQGAIIHGAIVDFNGGRASFGDCLSTGLKHLFPLLAIAIIMTLGIALGMLLLIVPGIILSIMWVVAVPARVVENVDIMDSFGRSRELTRNNRWKILGLYIIYAILAVVVGMVAMLPVMALGYSAGQSAGYSGDPSAGGLGAALVVVGVFNVLSTVLTAVISATGVSALYYELRKSKEGVGADALAKVFE